jgi:hypothetical protein
VWRDVANRWPPTFNVTIWSFPCAAMPAHTSLQDGRDRRALVKHVEVTTGRKTRTRMALYSGPEVLAQALLIHPHVLLEERAEDHAIHLLQ